MRKRNTGFTLLELMVVIAIILVLAGALVARMTVTSAKAKEAKAKSDLDQIASACRNFNIDTGLWPINGPALMVAPNKGLNETGAIAGVDLPAGSWKGPYLEAAGAVLPNDPWDQIYIVEGLPAAGPYTTLQAKCTGADPDITVVAHRFAI